MEILSQSLSGVYHSFNSLSHSEQMAVEILSFTQSTTKAASNSSLCIYSKSIYLLGGALDQLI